MSCNPRLLPESKRPPVAKWLQADVLVRWPCAHWPYAPLPACCSNSTAALALTKSILCIVLKVEGAVSCCSPIVLEYCQPIASVQATLQQPYSILGTLRQLSWWHFVCGPMCEWQPKGPLFGKDSSHFISLMWMPASAEGESGPESLVGVKPNLLLVLHANMSFLDQAALPYMGPLPTDQINRSVVTH